MAKARGPRIKSNWWQTALGVGGPSNPGKTPPAKRTLPSGGCDDCEYAMHAHDKQRVYTEGGRYHYRYECP